MHRVWNNAVSINTVTALSSHLTTPGTSIHWENWLMKGWVGVVKSQRPHTCWYFTWFWKSRCHHLVDDTYLWRNSVEERTQQPREAGTAPVLHLINTPWLWQMRPALAASSRSSPQLWAAESFWLSPIPDISCSLVLLYLKHLRVGEQTVCFSLVCTIEGKKRTYGITFRIEMTY